ncbi:DUF1365 domain-containing protein [Chitinibacter sp. GC72]|uniref:DUF1365 domain-containing protein n=1 Tax=Chitinibacter sp. GC72 TaxID=1526917 RepID=UPI001E3C393E|nr:DUF1365 domain-containing protein [Chitinibacter sp. GC72]
MMAAAAYLLRGQVMHARLRPIINRFVYPVFCVRLNLARLTELRGRWFGVDCARTVSVQSRDYGPRDGSDLLLWIRQVLREHELPHDGEVWLQTFPRVLGFVFNPVSFWYCHDANGDLRAVLAEVNNTFGDTHRYLLVAQAGAVIDEHTPLLSRKLMHVSPFCAVAGHYQFRLRDTASTAFVGIDYFDDAGLLIKTAIGGYMQPLNDASMLRALLAQPLLTLGVFAKIHWQAVKLWCQKVPFYRQPPAPEPNLSFQTPLSVKASFVNDRSFNDRNLEERSS